VPKQRPRRGKNGHWYTPKKTREYERAVRMAGWSARFTDDTGRRMRGAWPLDARYRVTVEVHFPDKRRRDADNVVKSVLDGLNTILWDDDVQVKEHSCRVSIDRENPRLEVSVEVMG
jgi:Holliday junction resolvase RusA-like endonuclease